MTREELFEAVGYINAETIEKYAPDIEKMNGRKRIKRMDVQRWAVAAAVFAVIVTAGAVIYCTVPFPGKNPAKNEGMGNVADNGQYMPDGTQDATGGTQNTVDGTQNAADGMAQDGGSGADRVRPERYVDIAALLDAGSVSGAVQNEAALCMAQVKIGEYPAWYEKTAAAASSQTLKENCGAAVDGTEGWYRVSGHKEAQYLIRDENGVRSLWKFNCFDMEEYPYGEVLKTVYGMKDAEDIRMVSAVAATMDMSGEAQRIQAEIGEYQISERADIEQLYEILSRMTCYGKNHWELIDYGQSDERLTEAVRLGRYLRIETENGAVLDSLKYTAVSGMFYEYGGIAYNRLSAKDRETVERILHIDNGMRLEESGTHAGTGDGTGGRTAVCNLLRHI